MNDEQAGTSATARTTPLATWSLVLGILGVIPLGLLGAVPAVICGHIALPKIGRSNGAVGGRGLAVAGLVLGYAGIVLQLMILPAMLLPAVASARGRARRVQCANNLSQIGKSCYVYSMENDGQFPPNFLALAEEMGGFPKVFVCPATGKKPGDFSSVDEWSDYFLVPNRSQSDPADAVLAFSKPECYPNKGGNVLTVDCAVRWCDIGEYEEITAEFR